MTSEPKQLSVCDVAELFLACFGRELDLEWWQWKYGPMNGVAQYAFNELGFLIGHYAGFPRVMLGPAGLALNPNLDYDDSTERSNATRFEVLQIGDVMVHPRARSSLVRRNVFYNLAEAFIDSTVGCDKPSVKRRYQWIYGFPNRRHLKLGELHKLYGSVGKMYEFAWGSQQIRKFVGDFSSTEEPTNYFKITQKNISIIRADRLFFTSKSKLIDRLIQRVTEELVMRLGVCIGLRSSSWLVSRYLTWPSYQVYFIFRNEMAASHLWNVTGDQDMGIFVLRHHGSPSDVQIELIDIFASESLWENTFISVLIQTLAHNANKLSLWASMPLARRLEDVSTRIGLYSKPLELPFDVAAGKWAAEGLENSLWVSGGDTDFR